jgi:hypothetical protein
MSATNFPSPMAMPFKVAHFQQRRWAELKARLESNRLFRAMDKLTGPVMVNRSYLRSAREGFLLPRGAHAAVDEAVQRLWTVARLSCAMEVRIRSKDTTPVISRATLDKQTLVFSLPGALLDGRPAQELVYHLAVATFFAMDTTPRVVYQLLRYQAPFRLADRMKAYELLRLTEYAADCFALVCTGDLELTLREGFYRSGVGGLHRLPIDLRTVARHHLEAGDLTMSSLIENGRTRFDYAPLTPLVLEQFQASEIYRQCRGKGGGTPRVKYEEAVLELERRAHPPMEALPHSHLSFLRKTLLLATFATAEAASPVTETRKAELLGLLCCGEEEFAKAATQLDWDWQEAGMAIRKIERLMRNEQVGVSNVHVVEIVENCVLAMVQEHDGDLPTAVKEILVQIGGWGCLSPAEVEAVTTALAEDLQAKGRADEQTKGEDPK